MLRNTNQQLILKRKQFLIKEWAKRLKREHENLSDNRREKTKKKVKIPIFILPLNYPKVVHNSEFYPQANFTYKINQGFELCRLYWIMSQTN